MRWSKWLCAFLFVLVALQGVVLAQGSGGRPLTVVNRIRVEYDDNIRQEDQDADSSLKIVEDLEFHLDMNLEQTFLSLRYRPSFVWWDDREEDDSDIHHDLDFILNHQFDPRLSLSIKDTFRLAELPELVEDNAIVRQQNDFIYNTLNGTLSVKMQPDTRLEVGGRHIMLRYDESDVGNREDYDLVVGGVTLRHQLLPETSIAGDLRYEQITYDNDDVDRGSSSIQGGLNLEHALSPNLLGNARAGYQHKEFDDSEIENESSPYVDASLTVLPSPATRITLGAGYSLFESGVFPYANQQRTRVFASLAHDVTAKVSCYLSAVYTQSDYDAEQIPGDATGVVEEVDEAGEPLIVVDYEDGTEDVTQVSARATYKVNRNNWLEAGWQYTQLESDLSTREEFERNRLHVGWKIKL